MSLKLYEIADEYRTLISFMESSEEEEIDADSFLLALAALESDFTSKVTNIGCLIREITAESQAVTETAKTLQSRAQRLDKRADLLRNYLCSQMQIIGLNHASDRRISIALKRNPASVQVESPDCLPPEYCRVIPERREPDKTAIKTALKSGITIPGCALIQTTRLDIK